MLLQSLFAPPSPKSNMTSPGVIVKEGMYIKKHTKTKIGMRPVIKAKVGELEKTTREGRSMRMRNKVVVCVQNVVGNKKLLFQFEDGQKKEISSSSLVF